MDNGGGGRLDRLVGTMVRDGVAELVFAHPPLNTLDALLRGQLAQALAAAEADPQVGAITIRAQGRYFSAGTEVVLPDQPRRRQLRAGPGPPGMSQVCDRIEACAKPVVVLLPGPALGGGAELALAGHYRLALPAATLGFPEVRLGLPPGAGGSQRLARLAGVQVTLDLLLGGRPIAAAPARQAGLIDGIVTGDLATAGQAFAEALIGRRSGPRPSGPRRARMQDGKAWLQAIAHRRAVLGPGMSLASDRIIDCVEAAALLPLPAGIAFERAAREDCLAGPDAQALHHLALAERGASPDLLTRGPDGRRALTPQAEAIAARLAQALGRAAGVLSAAGPGRADVDGALVDWGFAAGPFGGTLAQSGPQAVPVQRRVLAALVAEGARLLAAGRAARPGDIDAIAVQALGFPRARGGPLHAAQVQGLAALVADMTLWAAEDAVWDPPPLLAEAARSGTFDGSP